MRHPRLRIGASWQARICFVLAGAIFVLSQFIAAGSPPGRDDRTARGMDSILAETESGETGTTVD
ncbi:MAG: hypothetical protein AB7S93_15305 [Xanthobacteraceae bacterium]